jgi:hypothetical protein
MTHIHFITKFRGGDPAPKGYLEWHEWARVQLRSGLRQKPCPKCGKYKFPQELSGEYDRGKQICNECA